MGQPPQPGIIWPKMSVTLRWTAALNLSKNRLPAIRINKAKKNSWIYEKFHFRGKEFWKAIHVNYLLWNRLRRGRRTMNFLTHLVNQASKESSNCCKWWRGNWDLKTMKRWKSHHSLKTMRNNLDFTLQTENLKVVPIKSC